MTALGLHQDQDLHQDPWAYNTVHLLKCQRLPGSYLWRPFSPPNSLHSDAWLSWYYDSCLSAGFPHLHAHYRSVCDSGCSNIVLSSCPKSCMSSHIHICIFKVANKLQVTSLNREYQAQLIPDQILEVVNIQLQISEDKK